MEDHRVYVGGDFEKIGQWQFDFLLNQGSLKPNNIFLDIACGSLRLGRKMIPYLDDNCYFGIDSNEEILKKGIELELKDESKSPQFSVNSNFDFSFCSRYDIAWANSLFSHLTKSDIEKCFVNLKKISQQGNLFYSTYFEESGGKTEDKNPSESHARKDFYYKFETICEIANRSGWEIEKIESTNHPRNQKIIKAGIK